ncbi:MAG: heavy-metal-associated domain-containing protein [Planctomycetes bacterium]|nr:heavy-metal-associated domain-containing protein [Planctomycetota bacterium]
MPNLTRSVERAAGVRKLDFDLNTGRGTVSFEPGKSVTPQTLWEAIARSGFTPERIELNGTVYEGPPQATGEEREP